MATMFKKDRYYIYDMSGSCWSIGADRKLMTCAGPGGSCEAQIRKNNTNIFYVFVFRCSAGGTITIDDTEIVVAGYDTVHRVDATGDPESTGGYFIPKYHRPWLEGPYQV